MRKRKRPSISKPKAGDDSSVSLREDREEREREIAADEAFQAMLRKRHRAREGVVTAPQTVAPKFMSAGDAGLRSGGGWVFPPASYWVR